MWYTYILRSERDGRLYAGSRGDLKRRVKEHKDGRGAATRNRRPLTLEAYFKTGSGIATLRKRILTSEVRRT